MHADIPARSTRTRQMATAALLVALLAASAWVVVPIGAVPVTLQVFVVVLTALLLDPFWAVSAIGLYLLLGAAGMPVFSGGQGGLGVLIGPTGGYLFGFIVAVFDGAVARRLLERRLSQWAADAVAGVLVIAVTYVVGTLQLALVAHLTAQQAVAAGVVPFVLPDIVKAAVAVSVAPLVRRAMEG